MNKHISNAGRIAVPTVKDMHAAVAARDSDYDGRIFYGVLTTGIFCKPSCASRRPRPDNLRFFLSPGAAKAAGFRACKRCLPDRIGPARADMASVARYIEAHADESLTLARLAARAGLSPSRLQKKFKAAFGLSPKAYQDGLRLGRLKGSLKRGDDVTGAIFGAGYGSTSRVYARSARNLGMSPGAYRDGGDGEVIHHACRQTALGWLMMAATARGICFVQFGDSRESLFAALRDEFPEAELEVSRAEQGPDLDAWIRALDAHFSEAAPKPDLPLDLRGTAFQLSVWQFLLSVREGEVLSYGELAERLGQPSAVRAVASACAANRVGVLVPCHRVLRANGELGGYRWGLERKRTLLDVERRRSAGGG